LASFEAGALGVDGAMADAKASIDKQQVAFGEHVQEAADALKKLQSGLASRAEEAVKSLQAATTALQSGSGALGAFNDLTPRIGSLEAQLDRVEQAATNVDEVSSRFTAGLNRSAGEMATGLKASVDEASGRIIAAADEAAGVLTRAAGDLGDRKDGFERELASTVERLSLALKDFRQELARLNDPEGTRPRAT
jgi:ABC-type transporter Mla subunit MlaD